MENEERGVWLSLVTLAHLNGAMLPSMLKTPSETISLMRESCASLSCDSNSAMSTEEVERGRRGVRERRERGEREGGRRERERRRRREKQCTILNFSDIALDQTF